MLTALEKEGLADNTIIVLWATTAIISVIMACGANKPILKRPRGCPLIICVPGQKTAGQKCDGLVEFIDIYPTLADLCGLPIPRNLDGVSLKPLLENPAASVNKVAISQYPRQNVLTGRRSLMGYSIRDERWRLTLWRDRHDGEIVAVELYDEKNDPEETVNLAGKPENKPVVGNRSSKLSPPSANQREAAEVTALN